MEDQDKNQKALFFGFILIVFVVLIFFSKNYLSTKKNIPAENSSTQPVKSAKLKALSPDDLSKMILGGKLVAVLDIRDPESFGAEHIIDSKNLSVSDLQDALLSTDKNRTYVIVDYTGENSVISLPDSLKESPNIFSLSGGFAAWKANLNATISAGNPSSFSDQSKVSYINCDELKKIIDSNSPNIYIIDVRTKDSFSQGHLKNAHGVPVDLIEKNYQSIPLGKKVVVYDDNGFYAFQAAVRLFDLGVMNVFSLSDGLDIWKQKGFEMVK